MRVCFCLWRFYLFDLRRVFLYLFDCERAETARICARFTCVRARMCFIFCTRTMLLMMMMMLSAWKGASGARMREIYIRTNALHKTLFGPCDQLYYYCVYENEIDRLSGGQGRVLR